MTSRRSFLKAAEAAATAIPRRTAFAPGAGMPGIRFGYPR